MTKRNLKINRNFNPSILHPYFFIRKGLLDNIRTNALMLNGKLLDFGCGSKPYEPLFGHVESYIGVDYYNEGHPHANEQIDVFYDGERIPFEDATFDSVFASEVFEHIFNLQTILAELNRIMTTEGILFITCPFVWPEHEKPYDYARYTLFALEHELTQQGFSVIKTEKSGNYVTAIMQMRISFINDVILPKLTFRILIQLARYLIIPLLNIYGITLNAILPKNTSLYLNNIIIAVKARK